MDRIDLSIIVPCYNEEKRLPETMHRLSTWAKVHSGPMRIQLILVIEPSSDRTLATAESLMPLLLGSFYSVVLTENEIRLGKGGTIERGVALAEGYFVSFMDADGSTDFSFFPEAVKEIQNGRDIVIASRHMHDSLILRKQPFIRTLPGGVFRILARMLLKLPYRDTQCGCKMFRRSAIGTLFPIAERGFAFDLELLMKALRQRLSVSELPCIWSDKEGSTVHLKDAFSMFLALLRLRFSFAKPVVYRFHSNLLPNVKEE